MLSLFYVSEVLAINNMDNIDNEKRYKVLLESYQKAYPHVLKQNQFKTAQRELNCVKNSPEIYDKFLLTM